MTFECIICKKLFKRYRSQIKNNEPTCSNACRNIKFKTSLIGENNPNFNNKWSVESKKNQSRLIKSKVDDAYRAKSSKANKGKTFSKERIEKMHSHRTFDSYSRKKSHATKLKIGIKSKEKFTEKYKEKLRQINESLGYWIPLNDIEDYKLYREIANWNHRMYDLMDAADKIKQHGIFNVKTNTKGLVRDHIYSRKSGFENKVFPEILRHPANCQLLLHADNVKKKKSRYTDADHITLEQLFEKILNYNKNWTEQDICVNLITRYKNGERYSKYEYIKKYYEHRTI